MKTQITNYIRAGYSGLYIVSPEEQRVEAEFRAMAAQLGFQLQVWSATTGLLDVASGSLRDCIDPMAVLMAVTELPEKSIILLRDIHLFLAGDPNPVLVRQFKEVLLEAETTNKVLVILGCRLHLPPELEREFAVIEYRLPGKEQLGQVLEGILKSANQADLPEPVREAALDAASGLTTLEAENAFALSIVEAGSQWVSS